MIMEPGKAALKGLLAGSDQVIVISNPTVFALHGRAFMQKCIPAGVACQSIIMGDGERYKSRSTIERLYEQFLDLRLSRKDTVIAFGGGVVGDTAGFTAATFKRGMRLIQAPTTLLAMVDSSIGGKVGINHVEGKNLIGAFHQPQAVLINKKWLATLGHRELIEGLGEILKVGFISSQKYLKKISELEKKETLLNSRTLFEIALEAMRFKAKVVAQDTHDNDLRMILNFGHTFGHAIEKVEGFKKFRHGEAVLAGMAGALYLSHTCNKLPKSELDKGIGILSHFRQFLRPLKGRAKDYVLPMAVDKKNSGGNNVFVLLDKIGKPAIKVVNANKKILDATSYMIDFVNG